MSHENRTPTDYAYNKQSRLLPTGANARSIVHWLSIFDHCLIIPKCNPIPGTTWWPYQSTKQLGVAASSNKSNNVQVCVQIVEVLWNLMPIHTNPLLSHLQIHQRRCYPVIPAWLHRPRCWEHKLNYSQPEVMVSAVEVLGILIWSFVSNGTFTSALANP